MLVRFLIVLTLFHQFGECVDDGKEAPFTYQVNEERDTIVNGIRHFVSFSKSKYIKSSPFWTCDNIIVTIAASSQSQRKKIIACNKLMDHKFTILPLIPYAFTLTIQNIEDIENNQKSKPTNQESRQNNNNNNNKNDENNTITFKVESIKARDDIKAYQLSFAIKSKQFYQNIVETKFSNFHFANKNDILNNKMPQRIINEIYNFAGIHKSIVHVSIVKPNGPNKYAIVSITIDSVNFDATIPYIFEKIRSLRQVSDAESIAIVTTNTNGEQLQTAVSNDNGNGNDKATNKKNKNNKDKNEIKPKLGATSSILQLIIDYSRIMQVTEIDSNSTINAPYLANNNNHNNNNDYSNIYEWESNTSINILNPKQPKDWIGYFVSLFILSIFAIMFYKCFFDCQACYVKRKRLQKLRLQPITQIQSKNKNDSNANNNHNNEINVSNDIDEPKFKNQFELE